MSDDMTVANNEHEEEPDTFHDRDVLMRLAVNANRISVLFLVLFGVVAIIIVILLYWYLSARINLLQFIVYLLTALAPFFLGGFFWIGSQFISEGIYLLMDIEDNTRRPKSPEKQ